jgi:cytochrome c oxidase subunit 4
VSGPDEKALLYRVAAALLALLALTVGLSFLNLGPFSMTVALLIAAAKAILVLLFFMELRHSPHVLWMMAGAGVFWVLLLLGGTIADLVTRGLIKLPAPPGTL